MQLRELTLRLGLDLDNASFAKGALAARAVEKGLSLIVDAATAVGRNLSDAFIGFNARAEQAKMGLAGIAGMNLKLPWEEAKAAADELYQGLQDDAARTPAETSELVDFAQQIAGAYLAAGKNMKDLRQFTTQAVVAAKMLRAEGTAATDIKQAIQGRVGVKDMFAQNIISTLGMTVEQFNKKSMKERADLFAQGLNNPTIRAAMAEYEDNWDGVTSTLRDNVSIIAGEIGKPIFKFLKGVLKAVGKWVIDNKKQITAFFAPIGAVFKFLSQNIDNVILVLKGLTAAFVVFNLASVAAAAKAAIAWGIAAAPFIAMASAIALVLLFLDDIKRFREGRDSLFGDWAKTIREWQEPNAEDPWWLAALKQLVIEMEKALGLAEKMGLVNGKGNPKPTSGSSAAARDAGQFEARDPLTGAKVPSPFIGSRRGFSGSEEPSHIRSMRALEQTGSRWEAFKARLGFGEYGNYVPEAHSTTGDTTSNSQINYVTVNGANKTSDQLADEIVGKLEQRWDEKWDSKMEEATPLGD